jgi:hypothetical protein
MATSVAVVVVDSFVGWLLLWLLIPLLVVAVSVVVVDASGCLLLLLL